LRCGFPCSLVDSATPGEPRLEYEVNYVTRIAMRARPASGDSIGKCEVAQAQRSVKVDEAARSARCGIEICPQSKLSLVTVSGSLLF